MNSYKSFVRKNRQVVIAAEGLASTATWLLPERLASTEMAPELISTAVGLLSVFNQHIVDTAPAEPKPGEMRPAGIGKDRADEGLRRQNEGGGGVPWALLLAVTKEMEVLTEMAAQSMLGDENKWGPVATIEAIKAMFRLLVFHKSGYEMIIDGGQTANERVASGEVIAEDNPYSRTSEGMDDRKLVCRSDPIAISQATRNGYGTPNGFHNGVYYPEAFRQSEHSAFEPLKQENGPFYSSPHEQYPAGKGSKAMAAFSRFQSRVGGPAPLPSPVTWGFPPRPSDEAMERDSNDFHPSPDGRRSFAGRRNVFSQTMNGDSGNAFPSSNGFYPHVNGNGDRDFEHASSPCPRNSFLNQTPDRNGHNVRPSSRWISPAVCTYPAVDTSHCHPTDPSAPFPYPNPSAPKAVSIVSPRKGFSSRQWAHGVRATAEVLHILRPLVYALMLRKYGRKTWLPWLASLGMDVSSLVLLSRNEDLGRFLRRLQTGEAKGGEFGEGRTELPAEQDELKRRQMLLALYLMRSPCFELVVQTRLEGVQSLLKPIPVVGTLAEKAVDLLKGIQGYHFYTAGS
eukprot:TRINITY_DN23232_c0_g1_i1.p1 TRINITY_DN23232_c0_g1~~TRINITY_DN23232_c0_g1_i1.p1  ORF type:complete len:568 (+),score=83.79 TRINITY_DN23232_c0_g1_i1:281-1984(+)